ncbi:MAG: CvpA family protein [Lentisphaerae bacterium]|nr:CvpA family protein [Lentisphaerota bacterium]
MQLNVVDIVAVLFVLLHIVLSCRRGLSEEIARLLGAIVAFWLGLRYHDSVAGWLADHTRVEGQTAQVVSYIGVVLLVMLASLLLTVVMSKLIKLAIPEGVDAIAGGVAGLVKGALYVAIIFLAMNLWPHDYLNRHFGEESLIGSFVMRLVPAVQEQLEEMDVPDRLHEQVEASREKVEALLEHDVEKPKAGRLRKWFSRDG